MDIELNFVNDSDDTHNTEVLFFSQNVPPGPGMAAAAWTVIENCGIGGHHPFVYPARSTIGYLDSYGNYTLQLPAEPGQRFEAVFTSSGDTIQASGAAENSQAIELANALTEGAITGEIYKDGRVYSSIAGIIPGGTAIFDIEPKLWVGTLSQVSGGSGGTSVTVSQDNTEISLLGIASADIVMTGGGSGDGAPPFMFTLQNIVMA